MVLISNDRGQREWLYLLQRFGESRLLQAIEEIPGKRQPFPLNVARVLGVALPPPDELPKLSSPIMSAKEREIGRSSLKRMLTELALNQ
jgi:hypothetical protein